MKKKGKIKENISNLIDECKESNGIIDYDYRVIKSRSGEIGVKIISKIHTSDEKTHYQETHIPWFDWCTFCPNLSGTYFELMALDLKGEHVARSGEAIRKLSITSDNNDNILEIVSNSHPRILFEHIVFGDEYTSAIETGGYNSDEASELICDICKI